VKHINLAIATGIAVALSLSAARAADITGAGATFPAPIYSKWAEAYKAKTGVGLNYQSIGSGGGIKQIEAKTVAFGASDKPLDKKELDKFGLLQFPTVMGGIVPVVNLPGVKPGELMLDGPTLANIYQGKITKWDDPAIVKLNPGAKLPSAAIAVVHRSDGSGTTFNFTYYLAQVSSDWKDNVGVNTAVEWPTGLGAKGNEGVAATVQQTANSIGYVEYFYAAQNKLLYTGMVNKDGKPVQPSAAAFADAAAHADWNGTPGYGVILANEPGPQTWPMTAATFILVYKKPSDPAPTVETLKFFDWAFTNGAKMAEDMIFIPMPAPVVANIKKLWAAEIVGPDGKPLYAGS
jgi:phosphate transport system substrate-binding protein